nr:hypothetical protein Iba_chr14fCG7120 [Ipomoea batatas]
MNHYGNLLLSYDEILQWKTKFAIEKLATESRRQFVSSFFLRRNTKFATKSNTLSNVKRRGKWAKQVPRVRPSTVRSKEEEEDGEQSKEEALPPPPRPVKGPKSYDEWTKKDHSLGKLDNDNNNEIIKILPFTKLSLER